MFSNFDISGSGLTAQRLRMDVISSNIANVNTTRTEEGGPYRRKMPVFKAKNDSSFADIMKNRLGSADGGSGNGVEVEAIVEDETPLRRVYRPEHPDADEDGYLSLPNVDVVTEMVDMIEASRAYEANISALDTTKNMAMQAIQMGS